MQWFVNKVSFLDERENREKREGADRERVGRVITFGVIVCLLTRSSKSELVKL